MYYVFWILKVCIDVIIFYEFKIFFYKVEKVFMFEIDVFEIFNEMIWFVKKMGWVGFIGVYIVYINYFNIGVFMEKGVRFIGNG